MQSADGAQSVSPPIVQRRVALRRVALSSVVLKAVMAVSGLVWVGFLLAHLWTNLHVFGGPAALNDHYAGLKANIGLLWGVRVALAVAFFGHTGAAYVLTRRSLRARPKAYRTSRSVVATFASRSMRWSGPLLLIFIVYHLLHLTLGYMPGPLEYQPDDDYQNVVGSFSLGHVAFAYVVALAALGLHLWHGIRSAAHSLGVSHPRIGARANTIAHSVTGVVIAGFMAIPLAALVGWLD